MDIQDIKIIYTGFILRGLISLSILAHIILFFWIFFRKGNPIGSIKWKLWLGVYLVADSIAALSLGNIFQTSLTPGPQASVNHQTNSLALWAIFILLQLGGHNTIIAFTLEENQFWWIHLLRFLLYAGTTLAIFLLSCLEGGINYSVLILLFASIIKSCERVLAINQGNIRRLIRSAQKNSDAIPCCFHINERDTEEGGEQGAQREELQLHAADGNIRALSDAYRCFGRHKDIYINHVINYADVNGFRGKTIDESLKLLEMELGFAYNMFYSKSIVTDMFWGRISWIFRLTSFALIIIAGTLFAIIDGHQLLEIDPVITIILLLKTIILEFVSFFTSLLSNHTLVNIGQRSGWIWRKLVSMIIACQNYIESRIGPCTKVGQFNLLSYSSTDCKAWNFVKFFLEHFDVKEFSDNFRYSKHVSLDGDQRTLLFEQVRSMSIRAQQDQNRNRALGTVNPIPIGYHIIEQLVTGNSIGLVEDREVLIQSLEKSFEERLLIYHVATELYFDKKINHPKQEDIAEQGNGDPSEQENSTEQGNDIQLEEGNPVTQNNSSTEQENLSIEEAMEYLKVAKVLSDYLFYLLVVHPSLLLPVLTPELRSYYDTRAAALRFFQDYCSPTVEDPYETMIDLYNRFSLTESHNYKNSMMQDGIKVARYLISKRNDDTGWLLCQLWLEMLCFATSQCKGQSHAKQLGKGREIFTIIWLYMIHLGMNYEYVVQKTGKIFFVSGNQSTMAPLQGQNNNEHLHEEQTEEVLAPHLNI